MWQIRELLRKKIPLVIDGAMGTQLQAQGMPDGANPAEFAMANPNVIKNIHKAYLKAGAQIILTSTFGGTKFKLPSSLTVHEYNKKMAQIAKEAIKEANLSVPCFVGGDIGPTGHFVQPLGDIPAEEMFEAYKEQAKALIEGGVDLIFIETQFDIAEVRIAVAAVKSLCNIPIFASMTFEDSVSLTGSTPKIFAATMENMQIDALGVNCGAGPEQMLTVVEELLTYSSLPIYAEPNAGLPELINDQTVFRLEPAPFAEKTMELAKRGVFLLGGCCGTGPTHIQLLCERLKSFNNTSQYITQYKPQSVRVTSRSQLICIGKEYPLALIGERINPTGKKLLSAEFQEGKTSLALKYAEEQIKAGTSLLDVNVGAAEVDEPVFLPFMVEKLIAAHTTPLVLDSSNTLALQKAMPIYPASALINSISGEAGKIENLAPYCSLWGCPAVLLPLEGKDLPATSTERIRIIEKLIEKAEEYGLPKHMLLVDVLALTAASDPLAPKAALETLEYCRSHNINTTIGLSNISFGLPARELVNSAFLSLAAGSGLNSCIGNPMNSRFKEELDSVNLLLGYDKQAMNFIDNYANYSAQTQVLVKSTSTLNFVENKLENAIIVGDIENIIQLLDEELAKGTLAYTLVNSHLIPALNIVGQKYEKKEYFLPQLLRSAETMQKAFAYLKPMLAADASSIKATILLATVEGDIHDIGKNIVGLILSNHGYNVIDIGKDVKASTIIEEAKKHKAAIIGLSALMTTTMPRMKDVIELANKENLSSKVIIGGAVVTQDYANTIGADGYSTDAVAAVKLVERLLS